MIAKRARLRSASAGAGNRVPAVGSRPSGSAGGRIDVEDCELRAEACEVDQPFGGVEHELRHLEPDEMIGRTVVHGHGQVGGELVQAHATPQIFIAARA